MNAPPPVPPDSPEGRPAAGDVYARLFAEGHRFDFFRAVRLLERLYADAPSPGETSDYTRERIRFRPDTARVFPATDIKRIDPLDEPGADASADGATGEAGARVTLTFMGLYGVDAPLPSNLSDPLVVDPQGAAALRDFLDIFNHRLYGYFYRAWKKYRPELGYRRGGRDRDARRFLSLAGLGTPGALPDPPLHPMRFAALAGRLGARIRNAEGLRVLLAEGLDGIPVDVVQNVPRWVRLRDRPGLGSASARPARLGLNTVVGRSVYDVGGKFRVRLGPLDLATFRALLPGEAGADTLHRLVRLYAPDHLDFDIELLLPADEVPPVVLGNRDTELGRNTYLGRPAEPVISRIYN